MPDSIRANFVWMQHGKISFSVTWSTGTGHLDCKNANNKLNQKEGFHCNYNSYIEIKGSNLIVDFTVYSKIRGVNYMIIIIPLVLFDLDLDGSLLELVGANVASLCFVTNKLTIFWLSHSASMSMT